MANIFLLVLQKNNNTTYNYKEFTQLIDYKLDNCTSLVKLDTK
jgi:hypothetical protein